MAVLRGGDEEPDERSDGAALEPAEPEPLGRASPELLPGPRYPRPLINRPPLGALLGETITRVVYP